MKYTNSITSLFQKGKFNAAEHLTYCFEATIQDEIAKMDEILQKATCLGMF